jgi:hypothetical protein
MLGNTLDNLSYDYTGNGNKLKKVSDSGNNPAGFYDGNTIDTDYLYDSNGI